LLLPLENGKEWQAVIFVMLTKQPFSPSSLVITILPTPIPTPTTLLSTLYYLIIDEG
jgi:hypothetical protein